jgi:hypothetical protein
LWNEIVELVVVGFFFFFSVMIFPLAKCTDLSLSLWICGIEGGAWDDDPLRNLF